MSDSSRARAVVLLCTTPSIAVARRLAKQLVTRRVAACVSCVAGADSYFWWQGRLDRARETLMIVKTTAAAVRAAIRLIKTSHPYTVPELIALPIVAGDAPYLAWLQEACRG